MAPAIARVHTANELGVCAVERPELRRVVVTLVSPSSLRAEWRLLLAAWLEENVTELRSYRAQAGFDVEWLVPEARAAAFVTGVTAFFRAPSPGSFFRAKAAVATQLEQLETRGAPGDSAQLLAPFVEGALLTASARLRALDDATARSALELTRREGELQLIGSGVLEIATASSSGSAATSSSSSAAASSTASVGAPPKNLGVLATSFNGAAASTTSSAAATAAKSRLIVVPSDSGEWLRVVVVPSATDARAASELGVVTARTLATPAGRGARLDFERNAITWSGPVDAVRASVTEWLAQLDALATRPISAEERASVLSQVRASRLDGGACDSTSAVPPAVTAAAAAPTAAAPTASSVTLPAVTVSRGALHFVAFGDEATVRTHFESTFELRVLPAPRATSSTTSSSEAAPSQ